jgi:multiple antibiotic resistance protein
MAFIVVIAIVTVLVFVMLRIAHVVGERLGMTGLNIATRILGLILAAIAIETMADGLKGLFPALAGR